MSSAYNDNLTSSLPICTPCLIAVADCWFSNLVWLLWLGLPILCWIEEVIVGIFVLFHILVGRQSAFHHCVSYWFCGFFFLNSFHYVEICSLYTTFGKSFCHEWKLNFVKCFLLHLLRWSCVFCLLLMWCITLIYLCILSQTCEAGMNFAWLWCIILFNSLLNSVR